MSISDYMKKIKKKVKKAKTIFLIAHKDLDLDAIGSSLGMYYILKQWKKEAYLIIDDETNELGVAKVLSEVMGPVNIIHSKDLNLYRKKRSLLIILDANKQSLLQNPEVLEYFEQRIMIDHHEQNEQMIPNALTIIDESASSTCEMITELISSYEIKLNDYISTALLSGIVLDTNNFVLKTTANTYYAAYYLTVLGADPKKVQYLLKQDLKEYVARQKVITEVEIINNNIAVAKGTTNVIYRKEELAKMADTLLLFNHIEASFVIGNIDKKVVGISARSLGDVKIGPILDLFGGGGGTHEGAARIEGIALGKIEKSLKKSLKEIKPKEETEE